MSSEQEAWKLYGQLPEHDRRLVDAWHDLGNDWVTSLLNSGVLRTSGHRVRPDDARLEEFSRRRLNPLSPALVRQKVCEHEAAHAVVAEVVGVRVVDIEVGEDGSGATTYEKASSERSAAIAAAAQVWIEEFRGLEFPGGDSGCIGDRRALAWHVDDDGARLAARKARGMLRERSDEVLRLAGWLERVDLKDEPRREQMVQHEIRLIMGRS